MMKKDVFKKNGIKEDVKKTDCFLKYGLFLNQVLSRLVVHFEHNLESK